MNSSRRGFLKTAAAGLVIGFYLPERGELAAQTTAAASNPAKINAWVRVGSDDSVTLMIHKSEMGQGTVTSLSQLLAEELECDWTKIRTEFPGIDPAFGLQGVFGSMSIRSSWMPASRRGCAGARDASPGRSSALENRSSPVPRLERRHLQHSRQPDADLRTSRRSSLADYAAPGRRPENTEASSR